MCIAALREIEALTVVGRSAAELAQLEQHLSLGQELSWQSMLNPLKRGLTTKTRRSMSSLHLRVRLSFVLPFFLQAATAHCLD